jgi:hypothetical protein
MVQLSATRCSCIAILWVSLVSFAAITLCVASQRVFIAVVYFVIDSVRKLLDTPSYVCCTEHGVPCIFELWILVTPTPTAQSVQIESVQRSQREDLGYVRNRKLFCGILVYIFWRTYLFGHY